MSRAILARLPSMPPRAALWAWWASAVLLCCAAWSNAARAAVPATPAPAVQMAVVRMPAMPTQPGIAPGSHADARSTGAPRDTA